MRKQEKKITYNSLYSSIESIEIIVPVSLLDPINGKFNLHLMKSDTNYYLVRTKYKNKKISNKKVKINLNDKQLISKLVRCILFFSSKYELDFSESLIRFIGFDSRLMSLYK